MVAAEDEGFVVPAGAVEVMVAAFVVCVRLIVTRKCADKTGKQSPGLGGVLPRPRSKTPSVRVDCEKSLVGSF